MPPFKKPSQSRPDHLPKSSDHPHLFHAPANATYLAPSDGERSNDQVASRALIITISVTFGLIFIFWCCKRCLPKRKKRRNGKKSTAVEADDSKAIRFASALTKQLEDTEGLTENMEQNEAGDDKHDKKKTDLGSLQYSIEFDFQKNELSVGIIQATGLPAMDMCGTSDPYVKLFLLPNKKKKYETKVHRKTLSPVFNETFVFKLEYAEISATTLVLLIFDFDRFSKHDQIGQIKIPLGSIDLCQTLEEWRQIDPVESDTDRTDPMMTNDFSAPARKRLFENCCVFTIFQTAGVQEQNCLLLPSTTSVQ
ncbi:unnamed protein product [Dibothriocephalus latus]|uniref:C2 domain-containing protein n=1 Tax=Dibothriocephalus latus TaxID=60516 RepID=A0A3P6UCE6_DIBLA|nr:unnamed protein product [Dibothriocephalus latus]